MQSALNDSIESLPRADSDWPVRVESARARISSRTSASRSGGSGNMLIKVIDAADLKFCLLLRFLTERKRRTPRLDTLPRARARDSFFTVASTVWEILAVKPCKFAQRSANRKR